MTPDAVFNVQEVLERVDGDRGFLLELIDIFLGETPRLLGNMREALATRDSAELELAAHSLKGSAGNFAAPALYELSRRLERMGHDGDFTEGAETFAALEAEMERLRGGLRAI